MGLILGEGYNELRDQSLRHETVLLLDILDGAVERAVFYGEGKVTVTSPSGEGIGEFEAEEEIPTTEAGTWTLTVSQDQLSGWGVDVENQTDSLGRLSSTAWWLDAGSYAQDWGFTGSFYALVDGGAVVQMQADGLAGFEWVMSANRVGLDAPRSGRSAMRLGNSYAPEYRIYLNPPSIATREALTPGVANVAVTAGALSCAAVVPGETAATLSFDADTEGTWHFQCDLDGDGVYTVATGTDQSSPDLHLLGPATAGHNEVAWDGTDASGQPIAPGVYDCEVWIAAGEFHFVGEDIETAWPGIRLFEVLGDNSRRPLDMFWDDTSLAVLDTLLPDGSEALWSAAGLSAGVYLDEASATNLNARGWGAFEEQSRGNNTLLDTYAWLSSSAPASLTVTLLSSTLDSDDDGISDWTEVCEDGTSALGEDLLVRPRDGYFAGGWTCASAPSPASSTASPLWIVAALGFVAAARRRG